MRLNCGRCALIAIFFASSLMAAAQAAPGTSSSKPASAQSAPAENQTATWSSYCSAEAGFCLRFPEDWKNQADVLQGAGVVISKPQTGRSEEDWPTITAASTLLPELPEGKESPSFDDVLNVMLESVEQGAKKKTLERKQTTAAGLPAQLLKIRYQEPDDKTVIEEGLFIDGEDTIYSVVLRCAPDQLSALEPAFQRIVKTWRLYEPKPTTQKTPAAPPK